MQHFIQASTTSGQTGGGDAKADDFQQESTFVKMILGNLAKADRMQFKKLSYFRLVFYKLYARKTNRSNRNVENTVESVEFHPENRLERLSFELSPQSFQLVEKTGRVYGW